MGNKDSKTSTGGTASSGAMFLSLQDTNLSKLKMGDLIEIRRTLSNGLSFCHWAVYVEDNLIIHVATENLENEHCQCSKSTNDNGVNKLPFCDDCLKSYQSKVRYDVLENVIGDDTFRADNRLDYVYSPLREDEIVERAKSFLGQTNYHLVQVNCEHFATWCRYGVAVSQQSKVTYGDPFEYLMKVNDVKAIQLLNAGSRFMMSMVVFCKFPEAAPRKKLALMCNGSLRTVSADDPVKTQPDQTTGTDPEHHLLTPQAILIQGTNPVHERLIIQAIRKRETIKELTALFEAISQGK